MSFSRLSRSLVYFIVLAVISSAILFLNNFLKQGELVKKTFELESSINQLNSFYRNHLDMVIEKRSYQTTLDNIYKENFERLELINEMSVDSLYENSKQDSAYQLLLEKLDKAYQLRVDQLKSHILFLDSIPQEEALALIFSQRVATENLSNAVELEYQTLLQLLLTQYEKVSNQYLRLSSNNFYGFIVLFFITLFLIIANHFIGKKTLKIELEKQAQKNQLDLVKKDMLEFRTTFDFAAIGMAVVAENGNWIRVNASLQRMLGYSEAELKKMNFQEITHPEDLLAVLEQIKRLYNREEYSFTMETRYFTKSGEILWINLNVSVVWEEEGSFRCFIAQLENISPRKEYLGQLQEQNVRFGNVIEGTRAGTWEWNVQSGETIFDETWANIIGYTLDEISPISIETWVKFVHPDDLQIANEKLQECFSKNSDYYECECRMKHKAGHWVWVLDRGAVMTWSQEGLPEKMYGTHIDISKFKELEFDLITKKAFTDAILDTIDVGIAVANPDGTLELFNKATLQLHGLEAVDISPEDWSTHYQILRSDLSDFLTKEEIPLFRAWSGERFQNIEFCIRHISGEIRYISCSGSPIHSEKNGFLGAVVAMKDISAQRAYEQAIQESERKFKGIFNSSFHFVGYLDPSGSVLEVNQTALDFAGLQVDDVVGKKFWECHWWLIGEETQQKLKESILLAVQGEIVQYEVAVWDKDCRPVTILFNIKPILNEQDVVTALISEGRLIQDIVNARKSLVEKNLELARFASIASHDLKEPLRMVTSFLQLLQRKYKDQLDEKGNQYIHFAVDASQRMSILITELLEFSKIGAEDTPFEWVEVEEVLTRLRGYYMNTLIESQGEIKWESVGKVWVRKVPFELLLRNLLGNSLKYRSHERNPIIEITSSEKSGHWEFSIRDNGIGFESEHSNTIFQLFKRLHSKEAYVGAGMGLAICKRIVEQFGGEIWATSELGKGSIFYFTISK